VRSQIIVRHVLGVNLYMYIVLYIIAALKVCEFCLFLNPGRLNSTFAIKLSNVKFSSLWVKRQKSSRKEKPGVCHGTVSFQGVLKV
jgi:hypothetical protein